MKKKSLLVIILTLICSLASAQITIKVNGVNYLIKNDVATVGSNYQSTSIIGNITIPSEVLCNEKTYPVVGICERAFYECNLLTSITLPESITNIEAGAFLSCPKLLKVNFANGLYQIGSEAFCGCKSLKEVTLPESLISIYTNAFLQCDKLEAVYVNKGNPFFESVDGVLFDKDVSKLVIYPNGKRHTHYVVPVGVNTIDRSSFSNSLYVKEINLPNTLLTISMSSFTSCLNLARINIPTSVKSIEAGILHYSSSIEEVHSESKFPPSAAQEAFSGFSFDRCKLYVPKGSTSHYKTSPGWSKFTQIIEVDESQAIIKHSVGINKNEGGVASINGVVLSNAFINIENKQKVTLSVAPDAGYVVESVKLDGKDITNLLNNGSYEIESLIQNYTFSISFRRSEMYAIKLSHAENGGISMNVEEGTSHAFKISTIPGWAINTVMFNGMDVTKELDADNNFITPLITDNSSIQVSLEKIPSSVISEEFNKVSVYTSNGELIVKDAKEGHSILVYNEAGVLLRTVPVVDDIMRVSLPNLKGIYIININNRSYKVSHN